MLASILFLAFAFALCAQAFFDSNLNYHSPSRRHDPLGIHLPKVEKRFDEYKLVARGAPPTLNFTSGIASGDPLPSSVILWTRLAPIGNATVTSPICVTYQVSSSQSMSDTIDKGTAYTSSDVDYTIKVEAKNLKSFTTYYYQFKSCDGTLSTAVGRTKTAPGPFDKLPASGIRFAVYSCSNFPFGYFNAYAGPVRRDSVDYVLHVGDYIYEYGECEYGCGAPIGRRVPDHDTVTLADYRIRHALYRTDKDALANHQIFPWIPTWDDHEVADNTWMAASADMNNTEESFKQFGGVAFDQRKANAVRAYWEWMPIRQVDLDDNLRVWRNFSMGTLLDLIILDTRHYDRSITDMYWNTEYVSLVAGDEGRSNMGSLQEHWFYNQLNYSSEREATWRIIGQQIVFSRLNESLLYGEALPLDFDAWDGYQSARRRTLDTLHNGKMNNTIVLSGDSHANWVFDLTYDNQTGYNPATGKGALGVEFAGTAVSSPSPFGANYSYDIHKNITDYYVQTNNELLWAEGHYRGYYELHLTYQNATAYYYGYPNLTSYNTEEYLSAVFTVQAGANAIQRPVAGGTVGYGSLKNGNSLNHTL